jgi:hypothetical protein
LIPTTLEAKKRLIATNKRVCQALMTKIREAWYAFTARAFVAYRPWASRKESAMVKKSWAVYARSKEKRRAGVMMERKEVRQSALEAVVLWEGWRTDIGLAVLLRGEEVEVLEEGYLFLWWWREGEGLVSVVRGVNDCMVAGLGGLLFEEAGSLRRRVS